MSVVKLCRQIMLQQESRQGLVRGGNPPLIPAVAFRFRDVHRRVCIPNPTSEGLQA